MQDAVSALLLVEGWAGESAVGTRAVVPEGFEDVTLLLDGGNRVHAQIKSRRESVGDYSQNDLAQLCRSVAGDHLRRSRAGMREATVLVLERPIVGLAARSHDCRDLAAAPR